MKVIQKNATQVRSFSIIAADPCSDVKAFIYTFRLFKEKVSMFFNLIVWIITI